MTNSPVYIVDDDADDDDFIVEAFAELGIKHELMFFRTGESVLAHLRETSEIPFMIICDVNLPKMNGFQLREHLLNEVSTSERSVPFIFWSTYGSPAQIKEAYRLSAHGFFIKGQSYADLKSKLHEIVTYWSDSRVPQ